MVADETFNVFGENASLGRVNVVIVAVSEGGGGKREGEEEASVNSALKWPSRAFAW